MKTEISQSDFVNALVYDVVCKVNTFVRASKYVVYLECIRSQHQCFKTHFVDVFRALGDIYIEDVDVVIPQGTIFGIYYIDELRVKFIPDWR